VPGEVLVAESRAACAPAVSGGPALLLDGERCRLYSIPTRNARSRGGAFSVGCLADLALLSDFLTLPLRKEKPSLLSQTAPLLPCRFVVTRRRHAGRSPRIM
jgi:hypothetical protein